MKDVEYSNREIDEFFSEIKKQLDRIEHQTTKHNGRMSKLENWQSLLLGGWSIITFIVLPLLAYVYIQDRQEVQAHIVDLQTQK